MKALQTRLDLILERIESPKFLKNDGLGNEIGFWVFDYPAKYELLVREHLKHVDEKLNKRGYRFVHLNIFEVLMVRKMDEWFNGSILVILQVACALAAFSHPNHLLK